MSDIQKNVLITVAGDTSGIDQSLDNTKNKLNEVNNTPTDKPFTTMKAALKAANEEAYKLGQQFGQNSQQFLDAAKKVAKLKDEFDEYKKTVDAFNPDNKLQALVNLGKGATGAIQGVSGAMAFLGVEGDNASETMKKLQGLMAFSAALNSVDDIKNGFSNFAKVLGFTKTAAAETAAGLQGQTAATEGATVATKGFGTAFKAIGIGLLISAIAYLVSNWDELKESVSKLIPGLGQAGEAFNKVKAIAFGVGNVILKYVSGPIKAIIQAIQGDFSGALDTVKGMFNVTKNFQEGMDAELKDQAAEKQKERTKQQIKDTEDQIKILKARGKETYDVERENLNKKLSLEKQGSEEYKKVLNEREVLDAGHQKQREDDSKKVEEKRQQEAEKARAKREAEQKKLEELLKSEREKLKQHHEEVAKITDTAQLELALSKLNEREKELQALENSFKDQQSSLKKSYDEDKAMYDRQLKAKQITQAQYNDAIANLNKEHKEASTALAENKGQKELEVNQKWNQKIQDELDKYNKSETERQRSALVKEFDDLIAVATGDKAEELKNAKAKALANFDATRAADTDVTNAQTNLITTQVENKISDSDTPEDRKTKLANLYAAQAEVENAEYERKKLAAAGNQAELEQLEAAHKQKLTGLPDEQAQAETQIDEAKKQAKIANMQAVGNALNTFSDIVGKQTVAGKAMAVAAATIDTYQGVTKALGAYPPPFNFVAAAAVGAAGLLNIKKIISTKVPGKSDGASAPPSINQAPTINATQLQQQQIQDVRVTNAQDQKPTRAYIVDRDLQNNQQKSDFLNKLGTI
jgi:hypothetical protein